MVNRRDLVLVKADGDEVGKAAALPDDPERTVPGLHESNCRLDDMPEEDLQLEIGAHGDDRLEQRVHPVTSLDRSCQPDLQFAKPVIEPQYRPTMGGFRADNEESPLPAF